MRLPIADKITISALIPTLDHHGALPVIESDAVAEAHLRSYQQSRRRFYAERGIGRPPGGDWDQTHYPFDPVGYHLIGHGHGLLKHAQQIRFFHYGSSFHETVLRRLYRMKMFDEGHGESILQALEEAKPLTYAQVGGWVAGSRDSHKHGAFLPYYCWALNRIFGVSFGYAPCRVENGTARFLIRIGAEPLTVPFYSHFYRGLVQILAFHAYKVAARYESLVRQAEDQLLEHAKLHVGTRRPLKTKLQSLPTSAGISPGGQLMSPGEMAMNGPACI